MAWNIGNTTVRNPTRIQEGLQVFARKFNGDCYGHAQETAFWNSLIDEGVVDKDAARNSDWNGRKWRSCFVKLGFITERIYSDRGGRRVTLDDLKSLNLGLSGKSYELTPIGQRLVNATTQGAVEDIFLRQLLRLEIPSPTEEEKNCKVKPLVLMLQTLVGLEQLGATGTLNRIEMAAFVQTMVDHNHVLDTAKNIIAYRQERATKQGKVNKRKFDEAIKNNQTASFRQKVGTFADYADTTFRYCRLTGLFSVRGTNILIQDQKRTLVDVILKNEPNFLVDQSPLDYLIDFYLGTLIPTDNQAVALQQIQVYETQIRNLGYQPEVSTVYLRDANAQELTDSRYQLEEQYRSINELIFAEAHYNDVAKVDEVLAYLEELKKSRNFDPELAIDDPPSFLEWSIWRAFLTFNHLASHPQETRRFKIDMDLRPISHAPGGGADIIMQYEDFLIVIEVTLLSGSRQEAAEGESVRRHVANVSRNSEKDVYGVFVAPRIDNNTADVFQRGNYYVGDEVVKLKILPLTMQQIIQILQAVKGNLEGQRKTPSDVTLLIEQCLANRETTNAPGWLQQIDMCVQSWLSA